MSLHAGDRVTHFLRPDAVFEIVQITSGAAMLRPVVEYEVGDTATFWCAQSVLHRVDS